MKKRKEQYIALVDLLNYLKENNLYWKEKLKEYNEIEEENVEQIYREISITTKNDILKNVVDYIDVEFTECFSNEEDLKGYLMDTTNLSNNNDKCMKKNGNKWEIKMTTGTTGKPFPVVVNQREEFIAAKYLMQKRKQYYRQANLSNGFLLAHEVDKNIQKMNYRAANSDMHEVIDYFIRMKPKWMFVSVNSLKRFVSAILNYRADDVKQVDVKFIEITGAKMYKEDEELVRKIFTCPIVNQYGCREAWYIAYQCSCGKLHINTDNLLVDIVDEKGEIIKEDGRVGEVIVTNLCAKTMPFVKYYLGDYASISSEECSCGNSSPILFLNGGRVSEQLKNTKYNGTEVFRQILRVLCFKKGVKYNKIYIEQDEEFHLSVFVELLSERMEFEQKFLEVSRAIIENFDLFTVTFRYERLFVKKDTFLKEPTFICKVN